MRHPVVLLVIACLLPACPGCTGTETGNPFDGEMRANAHSSDPAAVDIRAGATEVEQVWLSVGQVELIAADVCDDTEGGFADAPDFGTGDHAEPGETLAAFTVEPGDHCRALLPFAIAADPLPGGAPPQLSGRSIAIVGTIPGPDVRFVIASEVDRVVDIRAIDGAFDMSADNAFLFLGFDVATWLEGLDIASGTPDGNGVVIIDSINNPDLLTAFEANLDGGIELYRDDDRDGSADLDEQLLARGQPE